MITTPPSTRPMNVMNRPMPTAIPLRMLRLMAFRIASRMPEAEISQKMTPDTKTMPSAVCQALGMPRAVTLMMTDTKKKFSPMPGASAIG